MNGRSLFTKGKPKFIKNRRADIHTSMIEAKKYLIEKFNLHFLKFQFLRFIFPCREDRKET